jgi:hypothetical protein
MTIDSGLTCGRLVLGWRLIKIKAHFVEPTLLLRAEKLPAGWSWEYELDGFRAAAIKSGRRGHLRSRNDKDFQCWISGDRLA